MTVTLTGARTPASSSPWSEADVVTAWGAPIDGDSAPTLIAVAPTAIVAARAPVRRTLRRKSAASWADGNRRVIA